ncbi:hypothetical protein [Luteibacter yeojuensis]|uniref:Uncharacterized protein n=1 Tax=Luteibacter yeojuensis TaxID=345309 RepID=A0A7X5TRK5_9GAMM|nr:hypothetical protein [Luteibacter yeojuensis]NID17240.1 hypothetical protein [Luteibacter yeojuensis]
MHQVKRIVIALAAVGLMVIAHLSNAQAADPHQRIVYIAEAADVVCAKAATGGWSASANVSADVKAEVSKVLRKIVKAEGDAKAGVQWERHEGVLASQVLDAAKASDDCRRHVFDAMKDYFFPTLPHPAPMTTGKNSPVIQHMSGGTLKIGD